MEEARTSPPPLRLGLEIGAQLGICDRSIGVSRVRVWGIFWGDADAAAAFGVYAGVLGMQQRVRFRWALMEEWEANPPFFGKKSSTLFWKNSLLFISYVFFWVHIISYVLLSHFLVCFVLFVITLYVFL